jgi:hypothetical protein
VDPIESAAVLAAAFTIVVCYLAVQVPVATATGSEAVVQACSSIGAN